MATAKPKVTRKTVLLPIIGLVAFFLYIYLFNVDIQGVIATAQRADPLLYSSAILISLAEVFFHAVSWRTLLNALQVKISVIKSYLFTWYGLFMDIIVPAESVSGELCRVYLVTREQGGTSGKVLASLVLHRLLGMGINVAALMIGIGLLLGEAQINPVIFNIILFFTVAIAAILLLFIVFSFKENLSLKVINALIRIGDFITRGKWKLFNKLKEEAFNSAKMFHDSMQEYRRKPRAVAASLVLLAVNWTCSLSIPYLVFLSLGFPVSWSVILITSSIIVAVKSVPIGVPFEVGLPEITMTTLYVGLGAPADISATATILSRIITLWLRFFIGFIAQQWIELKPIVTSSNTTKTEKT
ncbi:MAG: flippase-like domain-containing protein [Candidatus Bathyarchaeota archaeon]|nr:flippase-like domain-containing protein [Candidatus Bathyarchaeota archaeon]